MKRQEAGVQETEDRLQGELAAWLAIYRHAGSMVKTIQRRLKARAGGTGKQESN